MYARLIHPQRDGRLHAERAARRDDAREEADSQHEGGVGTEHRDLLEREPGRETVGPGKGIPVRFSLAGDHGLAIFADGYPQSAPLACGSTTAVDGIQTVTAGASGLSYDAASDSYTYVWKTNKAWAQTCRQLIVRLKDGTVHHANFTFR